MKRWTAPIRIKAYLGLTRIAGSTSVLRPGRPGGLPLSVRLHAAAGDGVGGDGIAGIGAGIERILTAGELAHLQRAGDVVASVAHGVQGNVDAADVEEAAVVVEHEGEDDSLE